MSRMIKSVPLGRLPKIFSNHGVDQARLMVIIGYLIHNCENKDCLAVQIEVGKSLDLLSMEMMPRTMLLLEAGDLLIELVDGINTVKRDSQLSSWVVKDHALLLETN